MDIQEILKNLDELEAKATKGEWTYQDPSDAECFGGCTPNGCSGHPIGLYELYGPEMGDDDSSHMFKNKNDVAFICEIRDAYPLLREEIKRLQAEVELLKHPLPSPKEEKEFYEKAYHICNTGCGYGCTKGL